MRWFGRMLLAIGIASAGPMSAQAANLLAELLQDLAAAQHDTQAVAEYQRLIASPGESYAVREARAEYDDITPVQVQFYIFRQVCDDNALILTIDWADGYEDILGRFEAQMEISPERRAEMVRYVDSQSGVQRGDVIGWLYGPLAELAETDGTRIVNLYTDADVYYFAVVPDAFYKKWVGVEASPDIKVEDPGWQFENQLKGSSYARFMRK